MNSQILTKQPLKANSTYEQEKLDRLNFININSFFIHVFSSTNGTLIYEQSDDGITWTADQYPVVANTFFKSIALVITKRYFRTKFHTVQQQSELFISQEFIGTTSNISLPPGENVIGFAKVGGHVFDTAILHPGSTANGVGTPMNVEGMNTATITVLGNPNFVGTINFEQSNDGTNWFSIMATHIGTGAIDNFGTVPGTYRLAVAGLRFVRARISGYTSGTITITGTKTTADSSSKSIQIAGSRIMLPVDSQNRLVNGPTLILTIPFNHANWVVSGTGYWRVANALNRAASRRTFYLTNGTNIAVSSAGVTVFDSSTWAGVTQSIINGLASNIGTGNVSVNGQGTDSSENRPALAVIGDSLQLSLAIGASLPTSGNFFVHVSEGF